MAGSKELKFLLGSTNKGDSGEFRHLVSKYGPKASLDLCKTEIPRDGSVCHLAAKLGHVEILKMVLALGVDVNLRQAEGNLTTGLTPLHAAASYKQLETTKVLMQQKARVNEQDSEGKTALHYACQNSDQALVELLLQHRADINKADNRGTTPLQDSILRAPASLSKYLVAEGADVTVVDKDGQGLLHYAAEFDDEDVVKILIAKGVSCNLQDKDGNSPLHLSSRKEILQLLVLAGGDVTLRNKRGKPPVETQLDMEEFKQINEALARHSLLAKTRDPKLSRVADPTRVASVRDRFNKLARQTDEGQKKNSMLSELQSMVKSVESHPVEVTPATTGQRDASPSTAVAFAITGRGPTAASISQQKGSGTEPLTISPRGEVTMGQRDASPSTAVAFAITGRGPTAASVSLQKGTGTEPPTTSPRGEVVGGSVPSSTGRVPPSSAPIPTVPAPPAPPSVKSPSPAKPPQTATGTTPQKGITIPAGSTQQFSPRPLAKAGVLDELSARLNKAKEQHSGH